VLEDFRKWRNNAVAWCSSAAITAHRRPRPGGSGVVFPPLSSILVVKFTVTSKDRKSTSKVLVLLAFSFFFRFLSFFFTIGFSYTGLYYHRLLRVCCGDCMVL